MTKIFLITIIIISSHQIFLSQERDTDVEKRAIPKIVSLALPDYPVSAEILGLTGKVSVRLDIDQEGKVVSTDFNNGLLLFQNRIKSVLKNWKFEESDKKIRKVVFNFEFILLASDSEKEISAVYESPNTIKIYKIKREIQK